jgi:hypothetical protein
MEPCKHTKLVVRSERIIGSDQSLEVIRCESCGALISILYPEREGRHVTLRGLLRKWFKRSKPRR